MEKYQSRVSADFQFCANFEPASRHIIWGSQVKPNACFKVRGVCGHRLFLARDVLDTDARAR
jgi:hypothetical protein